MANLELPITTAPYWTPCLRAPTLSAITHFLVQSTPMCPLTLESPQGPTFLHLFSGSQPLPTCSVLQVQLPELSIYLFIPPKFQYSPHTKYSIMLDKLLSLVTCIQSVTDPIKIKLKINQFSSNSSRNLLVWTTAITYLLICHTHTCSLF